MVNKIIFALNNKIGHEDLKMIREAGVSLIDVELLLGSYKGIAENSYSIELHDFDKVLPLILRTNQESILSIDSLGNAQLVYMQSGETVNLGFFASVSKEEALAAEAYTYDIERDLYYIAK